ncbi:MAG: single-stranded DNA-binding protein [Pseudonocardiaceae bacterium]|nr:single-stranded DNA-binding protein [Pseudonocardiaceae bacterium]
MRNETPLTMVGTLVKTGETRRVGEDQAVVLKLRVASNERRFDKVSQRWVDGESLYLAVSCWRQLAENVSSLAKGDPVIVSGKLRTREWTTEQGERRSVVELEASAIGPDLARCTVSAVRRLRREELGREELGREEPAASGPDGHDVEPEEHGVEPEEQGAAPDGRPGELADAARPLVGATA